MPDKLARKACARPGLPLRRKEEDAVSEFSKVMGRRQTPVLGALRAPSAQERAWMERVARSRTRVPKGVYRYRSHQEANADWEHWQADGLTAEPIS